MRRIVTIAFYITIHMICAGFARLPHCDYLFSYCPIYACSNYLPTYVLFNNFYLSASLSSMCGYSGIFALIRGCHLLKTVNNNVLILFYCRSNNVTEIRTGVKASLSSGTFPSTDIQVLKFKYDACHARINTKGLKE